MRMTNQGFRRAALLIGAVCAMTAAADRARADAIYGCWSYGGEELEVAFDHVVTPGGAKPEAQIDRHGATYIAPPGERDAGARLVFRQLNEEMVSRRIEGAEAEAEFWEPCGPGEPVS